MTLCSAMPLLWASIALFAAMDRHASLAASATVALLVSTCTAQADRQSLFFLFSLLLFLLCRSLYLKSNSSPKCGTLVLITAPNRIRYAGYSYPIVSDSILPKKMPCVARVIAVFPDGRLQCSPISR